MPSLAWRAIPANLLLFLTDQYLIQCIRYFLALLLVPSFMDGIKGWGKCKHKQIEKANKKCKVI